MIRQYFNDLAQGIEKSLENKEKDLSARKRYALEVARLGMRLYSGENDVAWCGVLVPFEILNSMDVTSCFVEFIGAILASAGSVEKELSSAEDAGYSTDMCSYHRAIIGAAGSGLMPEPKFLVASTSPCSAGLATVENLARIFRKDLFTIHVPYNDDSQGIGYLADQLRAMTNFVSERTGRSFDENRFQSAIEKTNRARSLMIEIYELAGLVPTPARQSDLKNFAFVMSLLMGTDTAVEVAGHFRDEFAKKAEKKIAGCPGERIRLLWFQNRIQFKNPLEKMLEEEFKAVIVADELNTINWEPVDPEKPFESIAMRILANPLTGSAGKRIANLLNMIRKNRIDGVLLPCHWGCRQGTGARGLIEKDLAKEGIPVLNLEVDCIDPRNFAIGQLRTRIQAFMETIENRK